MQETNKNKNSFDDIIKEKLENYSLPLDNDSWNEIEKYLYTKPEKRTLWPWISGIAAAIAVILGWLIFSFNNKTINYGTTEQLSDHEEKATEKVSKGEIVSIILPANHRTKRVAYFQKPERKILETDTLPESEIIKTQVQEENPIADLPDTEHPIQSKNLLNKLPPDQLDTFVHVVLSKKTTSMSFHIGSGGVLLAMNNNNHSAYADFFSQKKVNESSLDMPSFLRAAILTDEEFSSITHYAPLSFGVSFRKELIDRFALESGLVYTFLASKFVNKDPERDAVLQLHYLGIPLNLHTKIIGSSFNKWGIYLSTGTMLEKGLLSHYSQNRYFPNGVNRVIHNKKIDGWQWSLNASLGVEYKVIKNYSIYLEPKISYYLENNQPESARTENPLIVGFNAGIRYSW
ncbi:MAG: PorT family protein [Dysgonamonadaceae bacterium]|jgi:hypothetical protein|nr:PorT family protein [Dysgonamonadaceae bacterium]